MTDDSHTLEPGSTFGQHRIVRLLGRGGMGEVYEAERSAVFFGFATLPAIWSALRKI